MNTYQPFTSPADIDPPAEDQQRETQLELLRRVATLLRDHIVSHSPGGVVTTPRIIACRCVVLQLLLDPDSYESLETCALLLGVSRARLSRIGQSLSVALGMRASWQRVNARQAYAERARRVHARRERHAANRAR